MPAVLKSFLSRLTRRNEPKTSNEPQPVEEQNYPHEEAFVRDDDGIHMLRPLSTTKSQIRLFTLGDPTDDSSSSGMFSTSTKSSPNKHYFMRADNLRIYDTDNCPPYLALSYEWGPLPPESETMTVHFPPVRIDVRPNLLGFLQMLRWALYHSARDVHEEIKLPQHVWVDQLCIDQSNDAERSVQVQNMGAIFS
jgi:hypothetical protein